MKLHVRQKIEYTEEFQARYANKRVTEKQREGMIKTVVRASHPLICYRIGILREPHIVVGPDYSVLRPRFMYEVVETGMCCAAHASMLERQLKPDAEPSHHDSPLTLI